MRILKEVSFDDLPFDSELATITSRVTKAITRLNGRVLPIELEPGDKAATVIQTIYNAGHKAGIPVTVRVHDGTIYAWRRRPSITEKTHASVTVS